jgi:hypothetical protein
VKPRRISIATLMVVVAAVAINLAEGRVLSSFDPVLLTGVALVRSPLQVS